MKTLKTITAWLSVAVGAFVLGLLLHYGVHDSYAQTLWNPPGNEKIKTYQISYHSVSTPADTKTYHPKEGDSFVAQAANGDAIEEAAKLVEAGEAPSSDRVRELQLRSKGLTIVTHTSSMYIMTIGNGVPVDPNGIRTAFGGRCENYASITSETKTILGFKTFRLGPEAKTNEDPTNGDRVTVTTDAWLAPDLDCKALEEVVTWKHNDVLIQTTVKKATKATLEGPPESAFEVRAGSLEVPPSVFYPVLGQGFDQRQEDAYKKQKEQREKR
jgi:hypothetical protein